VNTSVTIFPRNELKHVICTFRPKSLFVFGLLLVMVTLLYREFELAVTGDLSVSSMSQLVNLVAVGLVPLIF